MNPIAKVGRRVKYLIYLETSRIPSQKQTIKQLSLIGKMQNTNTYPLKQPLQFKNAALHMHADIL